MMVRLVAVVLVAMVVTTCSAATSPVLGRHRQPALTPERPRWPLSASAACDVALLATLVGDDPDDAAADGPRTRNMTDVYRARWTRDDNATVDHEPWALDPQQREGGLTVFLHQSAAPASGNASAVTFWADAHVRRSRWEQDQGFLLRIQGLYWPSSGVLLGVANPHAPADRVLENVELGVASLDAVTPQLVAQQLSALPRNATRVQPYTRAQSGCYYVLRARVGTRGEHAEPEWRRRLRPETQLRVVGLAAPFLTLRGVLASPNCNVTLRFDGRSVFVDEMLDSARTYVTLMGGASVLHLLGTMRQLAHTSSTLRASRVSGSSAIVSLAVGLYIAVLHCVLGLLASRLFMVFVALGFGQMMIFALYDLRYVVKIWIAREAHAIPRALVRHSYVVLLASLALVHFVPSAAVFLLLPFYSFWVPQIVENARSGSRHSVHWLHLCGVSGAHLVPAAYFLGSETNFLSVVPWPAAAWTLVLWVVLQVAILCAQDLAGPRLGLSAQPPRYDYTPDWRDAGVALLDGAPASCVICMEDVSQDDIAQRLYMVAPCRHVFHASCLRRWMDTKMECPTCRTPLPLLGDDGVTDPHAL